MLLLPLIISHTLKFPIPSSCLMLEKCQPPLIPATPSFFPYALRTHFYLVIGYKLPWPSILDQIPILTFSKHNTFFLSSLSIACTYTWETVWLMSLFLRQKGPWGKEWWFLPLSPRAKNTEWVLRTTCWIIEWINLFDTKCHSAHVIFSE